MFSKIEKFKAAAWEKSGKHDAGHKRCVLLAGLISVGIFFWFLLKFIWSILAAMLGETNRTSTTNPNNLCSVQNEDQDTFGRKHGDVFFGQPTSDLEIVADMNKDPQH